MKFTKGDRVRHPGKPEWDTGQVLEDCTGADVRVYFAGAGEKKLRLDYVTLSLVEGEAAAHPVLDSLGKRPPRAAAPGKRGKKTPKTRGVAQLVEDFQRLFPEGFRGAEFERKERAAKVGAHDLMTASLSREQMDALASAGEYGEIGRRALRVVSETSLVFPREAISLKNALQSGENQRPFAEALRALLYGEADAGTRFAAFCDCLSNLGAAKWPIATYFPFVAFPEREMFLKPTVTRKVAEMLGFELNYRVEPNWLTYSKLLELSRQLFDSLAELRPRDMFDVQSFISSVANPEEGDEAKDDQSEPTDARRAPRAKAPEPRREAAATQGEAAATRDEAAATGSEAGATPGAAVSPLPDATTGAAGAEASVNAEDSSDAVDSADAGDWAGAEESASAGGAAGAGAESGKGPSADGESNQVGAPVAVEESNAIGESGVEGSAVEGSAIEESTVGESVVGASAAGEESGAASAVSGVSESADAARGETDAARAD